MISMSYSCRLMHITLPGKLFWTQAFKATDTSTSTHWIATSAILALKIIPREWKCFGFFLKNAALCSKILKKEHRLWLKKWCMLVISQKGFIEPTPAQPSTAQPRQCGFSIHHFTLCRVWKCFKNTGSSLFMPLYQHHISSWILS